MTVVHFSFDLIRLFVVLCFYSALRRSHGCHSNRWAALSITIDTIHISQLCGLHNDHDRVS